MFEKNDLLESYDYIIYEKKELDMKKISNKIDKLGAVELKIKSKKIQPFKAKMKILAQYISDYSNNATDTSVKDIKKTIDSLKKLSDKL